MRNPGSYHAQSSSVHVFYLQGQLTLQSGCWSSNHHISLLDQQKKETATKRLLPAESDPFKQTFQKSRLTLVLSLLWPELSHLAISSRKEGWEMPSQLHSYGKGGE